MALVFGDPKSIELRDKAEAVDTFRDCKTCRGDGEISIVLDCEELNCERLHSIPVECACCLGHGTVANDENDH